VEDKLAVVEALDALGLTYIEAGYAGANPKEVEFFSRISERPLTRSSLCAFGSTCRKYTRPEEDAGLAVLSQAGTDTVVVFGKCHALHAADILGVDLTENRRMIFDSVSYLKAQGKRVIFDAEHFFDGYRQDSNMALEALQAAKEAGADTLVLCDTNGGLFPWEISEINQAVIARFPHTPIGIHCHDDGGLAVANTIAAVQAGAVHIQGTLLGFGERTGNANLCTLIPDLQIKLGYSLIPADCLSLLTQTAYAVTEISNLQPNHRAPFVGRNAFTHKAGTHTDGMIKNTSAFEHIDPELVGNTRRFLISEVAGKKALLNWLEHAYPKLSKKLLQSDSRMVSDIMNLIKQKEHEGYQYEGASGSLQLLVLKQLGQYRPFFELCRYRIVSEKPSDSLSSTASIQVRVRDKTEEALESGNGPVNALDKALRKALSVFFPVLSTVHLVDYKVRAIDSNAATGACVRVLITSSNTQKSWTTVGVSTDIIEASLMALVDSIEYILEESD